MCNASISFIEIKSTDFLHREDQAGQKNGWSLIIHTSFPSKRRLMGSFSFFQLMHVYLKIHPSKSGQKSMLEIRKPFLQIIAKATRSYRNWDPSFYSKYLFRAHDIVFFKKRKKTLTYELGSSILSTSSPLFPFLIKKTFWEEEYCYKLPALKNSFSSSSLKRSIRFSNFSEARIHRPMDWYTMLSIDSL